MERNVGRQAAHAARLAAGEAARPDPIARPAADRTVTQAGRKARGPQPGRCPRMPATRSCLPPSEVGPGNRSGWHAHGVVVDRHVSAIGGVIVGEAGHLLTLCDTGGNGFLRACRARAVFLVKATSKSLSLSPRRPSFALLERFLIILLAHPPEPPQCTRVLVFLGHPQPPKYMRFLVFLGHALNPQKHPPETAADR